MGTLTKFQHRHRSKTKSIPHSYHERGEAYRGARRAVRAYADRDHHRQVIVMDSQTRTIIYTSESDGTTHRSYEV